MKYGVWCIYEDKLWDDGWAGAGLAKFVEPKEYYKADADNKFCSENINFAFRYRDYLHDYYKNIHSWKFEVREK